MSVATQFLILFLIQFFFCSYITNCIGNAVGKQDGAAGNQPKECIKGVSEEQNKTKLNYVLVGRSCNLESP
jgi:hypothetical protein